MKKDVDKQVNAWYMLGRVAPIGALFLLCLVLIFDVRGWIEHALIFVGTVFAVIAFTWWWWVLDTVKELFNLLKGAHNRFDTIITDIQEIKKEDIQDFIIREYFSHIINENNYILTESRKKEILMISRTAINLESYPETKIGCNAIFRDIYVDHLVCCDKKMVKQALSSGTSPVYTRQRWIADFPSEDVIALPDLPYNGDKRQDCKRL